MRPSIDIIYNMTSICPHDCAVCCVDAAHVTRRGDHVRIKSKGLTVEQNIPRGDRGVGIYDVAAKALQAQGAELTFEQKSSILANIDLQGVRLDISGGDPLCVSENVEILRMAGRKLGRAFVTLTATGAGMAKVDLADLVNYVGEFNFTFDSASPEDVADRPLAYASRNIAMGRDLVRLGATTRAEFPITRATNSPEHIERLYTLLHKAGIHKLLLMRMFTVGRGHTVSSKVLGHGEYIAAIRQFRELEKKFGSPSVKLQCALRHIEGGDGRTNPCDFVSESFGLTPKGILLASPWAINARGEPLDDAFVLGDLVTTPLSQILASDRVTRIRARANENFGHCKIFAWQNSSASESFERLFDATDPLYARPQAQGIAAE